VPVTVCRGRGRDAAAPGPSTSGLLPSALVRGRRLPLQAYLCCSTHSNSCSSSRVATVAANALTADILISPQGPATTAPVLDTAVLRGACSEYNSDAFLVMGTRFRRSLHACLPRHVVPQARARAGSARMATRSPGGASSSPYSRYAPLLSPPCDAADVRASVYAAVLENLVAAPVCNSPGRRHPCLCPLC
jgi:hypothetical protein